MVRFHLRRFEAWIISFTPLCPCLSEETVKAVGSFYLVSTPGEIKYPTQKNCDGLTLLSNYPDPDPELTEKSV